MDVRRKLAAVVVATGLTVTACSSSGGGGGSSQSKIASQLKKDPDFKQLIKSIPSSKQNVVTNCVAKALQKAFSGSEINAFTSGKKKLADLKPKSGSSTSAASTEAQNCVKSAIS